MTSTFVRLVTRIPFLSRTVLDRVLDRFGSLLPAKPTAGRDGGPGIKSLEPALIRRYRAGNRQMFAGIGQSSNGQLLVEVVYGPPALFESGQAARIFSSLADRA